MRSREIEHSRRDNNRIVRPFEWGLEFITEHVNGDDPRLLFRQHADRVMSASEDFYALPEIPDYRLAGAELSWTSAVNRGRIRWSMSP